MIKPVRYRRAHAVPGLRVVAATLDEGLVKIIDKLAGKMTISRSEAMEHLLRLGLEVHKKEGNTHGEIC